MSDRPSIGARIKALREIQGITLTELASACDMSKSYLSTLESGLGNPTLDVLTRIAAALDMTLGDLVGGPKRRARMAVDLPDEQLPEALLDLVKERRAAGRPLESQTVRWLAGAKFRGKRPATKEQFMLLLTVVGET